MFLACNSRIGDLLPSELSGREAGPLAHHPVLGRARDLVQRREEAVLGRALEVTLLANHPVVLWKHGSLIK